MTNDSSVVKRVPLQTFKDDRGGLVVAEPERLGLFNCRRVFIVHGVPAGATRGAHAHRVCHQLLIAVSGSVMVEVDDGTTRGEVRLDSPETGLYLPPMTWGVQRDYSPNCSLLVLASHPYDAEEYIHDYDEFRALSRARP